jgi:hypothetical protein
VQLLVLCTQPLRLPLKAVQLCRHEHLESLCSPVRAGIGIQAGTAEVQKILTALVKSLTPQAAEIETLS